MDSLQTSLTSLAVVALLLLMAMFVCHYLGPRATAWAKSNREEKIGLSKSKLFNANGYMIHSSSDFLLSSSGSFKRFDSIDRDYKQVGQSSLNLPAWNLPQSDIPPQPLRPAPAPVPSPLPSPSPSQASTKPNSPPQDTKPPNKQRSLDSIDSVSTAIPRPVAKRQLSSPAKSASGAKNSPINLSETVTKIQNGYRTSSTNPFLNGTLKALQELSDNQTKANETNKMELDILHRSNSRNPFTADCVQKILENNRPQIVGRPAPKTDVDRTVFFDFEPTRISSLLDSSVTESPKEALISPINSTIIEETAEDSKSPESPLVNHKSFEPQNKDTGDSIERMLRTHFRNRSFSETEVSDSDLLKIFTTNGELVRTMTVSANCTNPFLDKSLMHKTCSEDHLTKNVNQTWGFGRSLFRQDSSISLGRASQTSLDSDRGSMDNINLQRALSCDSVSSESSVVLADLEQVAPAVTGMLCVGLQYDKSSLTEDGMELVVTVMEAKELIAPFHVDSFNTFVRIYLVPDEATAMQTKVFKNSLSPSYNETFCFWINKKRTRRSLWFHLYHCGNAHTLIGEAELQIGDVARPLTTWLPLSDSRQSGNTWGELMFSLSYLPTAERLTVVVVKGRNLKLEQDGRQVIDLQNIFIKVYLLKNDKKVSKKKTSLKRADRCPIFNESMIFSIPPYVLNSIQIRLTAVSVSDTEMFPIGHVIVGGNTSGKGLRHWHQMLSSLRKPVAMWHALRQTSHRKSDKT